MSTAEKNALISAAIRAAVLTGKPVAQAVDEVLGAGTYAKIAGTLYDALRK